MRANDAFTALRREIEAWQRLPVVPRILLVPLFVLRVVIWPIEAVIGLAWLLAQTAGRLLLRVPPIRWLYGLFSRELWTAGVRRREPIDVLPRMRLVRRFAIPVIVAEWVAFLVMGANLGLALLLGQGAPGFTLLCLAVMFLSWPLAWALTSYHTDLRKGWTEPEGALCPACGYNRAFIPADHCPECGSTSRPLLRGDRTKAGSWTDPLLNEAAVFLPGSMLGTVAPIFGCFGLLSYPVFAGACILALTASFACLAVMAFLRALRLRRSSPVV